MANRPKADRFAGYIEGRDPVLVSAIEIYEVYKVIRRDLTEERAVGVAPDRGASRYRDFRGQALALDKA